MVRVDRLEATSGNRNHLNGPRNNLFGTAVRRGREQRPWGIFQCGIYNSGFDCVANTCRHIQRNRKSFRFFERIMKTFHKPIQYFRYANWNAFSWPFWPLGEGETELPPGLGIFNLIFGQNCPSIWSGWVSSEMHMNWVRTSCLEFVINASTGEQARADFGFQH